MELIICHFAMLMMIEYFVICPFFLFYVLVKMITICFVYGIEFKRESVFKTA